MRLLIINILIIVMLAIVIGAVVALATFDIPAPSQDVTITIDDQRFAK